MYFYQGGQFENLALSLFPHSPPQAIGDGGQGWGNAILYIFNSPKIRSLLLKDLATCCSRTANVLYNLKHRMNKVEAMHHEATTTSIIMNVQDRYNSDLN